MPSRNQSKLELSPAQMKALGYKVIDMIVDHQLSVADKPVKKQLDQAALEALLIQPVPEEGTDVLGLVKQLQDEIFVDIEHKIHPRDFAFIPGPSNFVSVMADTIASGFNIFSGAQITSGGATIIELLVIEWLCGLFGFASGAGGLFVSGGSAANLTGLATARKIKLSDRVDGARVYYSDQTHVSNIKALKLLGFQADQFSTIVSDTNFCIDLGHLCNQIAADRATGHKPFCVIANAGTTNTGAVDPLDQLATLCEQEDLWLHVDGAFGAAAALTDKGRERLKGLNKVDSLSFDPHKWFFQPYEIGGVIVRDKTHLQKTFATNAEYLRDIQDPAQQDVNFFDYGIQMTRGFRALKMWLSIKTFGINAFRRAIERGMELAEVAEIELKKSANWEIITPAQLGIVTFRYRVPELAEARLSEINQKIVDAMLADGFAFVLTTSLRGHTVLRICAINPRTTDEDIRQTIHKLEQFGNEACQRMEVDNEA